MSPDSALSPAGTDSAADVATIKPGKFNRVDTAPTIFRFTREGIWFLRELVEEAKKVMARNERLHIHMLEAEIPNSKFPGEIRNYDDHLKMLNVRPDPASGKAGSHPDDLKRREEFGEYLTDEKQELAMTPDQPPAKAHSSLDKLDGTSPHTVYIRTDGNLISFKYVSESWSKWITSSFTLATLEEAVSARFVGAR